METLPIKKLGYSLSNDEITLKVLKDSRSESKLILNYFKAISANLHIIEGQNKTMTDLLHKCISLLEQNYNTILPHLNISLSEAVKLHYAISKIMAKRQRDSPIVEKIYYYEPFKSDKRSQTSNEDVKSSVNLLL